MQIINKTRNTVLAEEAIVADTPWQRMKGLLGRKDLKKGEALIIKPCNSIHSCFMRFAIDVIFADSNHKIIGIITHLKPWRFSGIYLSAKFCIELPAGTVDSTHPSIGDSLSF